MSAKEDLAEHRARRRQRTLDSLREQAKMSEPARKLLAIVDPSGNAQYWPPPAQEDGK